MLSPPSPTVPHYPLPSMTTPSRLPQSPVVTFCHLLSFLVPPLSPPPTEHTCLTLYCPPYCPRTAVLHFNRPGWTVGAIALVVGPPWLAQVEIIHLRGKHYRIMSHHSDNPGPPPTFSCRPSLSPTVLYNPRPSTPTSSTDFSPCRYQNKNIFPILDNGGLHKRDQVWCK